jgi:hypothetical protein
MRGRESQGLATIVHARHLRKLSCPARQPGGRDHLLTGFDRNRLVVGGFAADRQNVVDQQRRGGRSGWARRREAGADIGPVLARPLPSRGPGLHDQERLSPLDQELGLVLGSSSRADAAGASSCSSTRASKRGLVARA